MCYLNALAPPLPCLLMNSKIASLSCSVFSVCLCMVLKFFVFLSLPHPSSSTPTLTFFCSPQLPLHSLLQRVPRRHGSSPAQHLSCRPPPCARLRQQGTPSLPLIRQIQTVMPNGSAHPGAATLMQAGPESGLIYATPYEYPLHTGPRHLHSGVSYRLQRGLGKHSYTCLTTQTPQVPEPPSGWAVDSHALHGCTLVLGGMTSHTMLYFVNVSALPYLHVL